MSQRLAAIPCRLAFALALGLAAAQPLPAKHGLGPVAARVLDDFTGVQPSGFRAILDAIRKPELSPQDLARIRAALPAKGELQPSVKEAQKLSAILPILQYHHRDRAIEVKLIDVVQAAVGLHARSLLLVSAPALRQLDANELQALAAHELGHDYFWDKYQHALDTHDAPTTQELELRCDAIAIFTLADLGLNPRKLLSGFARLNDFNARFGTPLNERMYVPSPERVRFVEAVIALTRRHGDRAE